MKKRSPQKARKKPNISRAKARIRAKKAWRTKYARYHYASEDGIYPSEHSQGGGDYHRQQGEEEVPGGRRRNVEAEKRANEVYGSHRMTDKDVDALKKEREEAKKSKFMRMSDILDDPEIKAVLQSRAAKGASNAEIDQFLHQAAAHTLANRRSERNRFRRPDGGEDYNYGSRSSAARAMEIVNSTLRRRPKRGERGVDQEAIYRSVASALGRGAKEHEVQELTAKLVAAYGAVKEGGMDAQEQVDNFHSARLLAKKIGEKVDARDEKDEFHRALTKSYQEVHRSRVEASQASLKWGQLRNATYAESSPISPRYSGHSRMNPKTGKVEKVELKPTKSAKELDRRAKAIEESLRNQMTQPVYLDTPEMVVGLSRDIEHRDTGHHRGLSTEQQRMLSSKSEQQAAKMRKELEDKKYTTELSTLSKRIAKHQANPDKHTGAYKAEEKELFEHLDSLRFRTATAWSPNMLHEPEVQALLDRYQHGALSDEEAKGLTTEQKRQRLKRKPENIPRTSEEFYKQSGHEEKKGIEGIKVQGRFVYDQQVRRFRGLQSGDTYYGWKAGKRVNPAEAAFGITANKNWRYRMRKPGAEQDFEEILHTMPDGQVVKLGGEGGGDPAKFSMQGTLPAGKLKGIGSSRFKDVPFGSDKRFIPDNAVQHDLIRTFEQPLNIRIGQRQVNPEYDTPLKSGVDKRIDVPLYSIKNPTSREHVHTRMEMDTETGKLKEKKTKIEHRYLPYQHTQLKRGETDQLAVKIPGRGRIGERVVFFNLENMDSTFIANNSKYLLGPARAREERQLREMTERVAKLRESEVYGTGVGETTMVRNDKAAQGRMFKRLARDERAKGNHNEADRLEKHGNALTDLAAAGALAGAYGARKRFTHYSGPQWVNEKMKGVARRSPRLSDWAKSWSVNLEEGLIDVKEGAWGPLEAAAMDFKFRLRHPTASPSGGGYGIHTETGYYRQRGITPARREARQLRRARARIEHLSNVEKFMEQAAQPNASRWKKFLRGRKDHLLRDKEFKEYLNEDTRLHRISREKERIAQAKNFLEPEIEGNRLSRFRRERARAALRQEISHADRTVRGVEQDTLAKIVNRPLMGDPGLLPMAPGEAAKIRAFHARSSNRNRNLLIGGAVVGTALGAGYLYHRHRQKKEVEAGLEQKTALERFTPHKKTAPLPHARVIGWKQTPYHPILHEIGLANRQIPNRFAVGVGEKTLWKGKPSERGYTSTMKTGITGLSFHTPRAGKTTGKIFMEPHQMKRIQDRPSDLKIGGKKTGIGVELGAPQRRNLNVKNPRAVGQEERRELARVFGLSPYEYGEGFGPRHDELNNVLAFYRSGVPDPRVINALTDVETVKKAKKESGDLRGSFTAQRSIRGKVTKLDQRREYLANAFSFQFK